MRSIVFAFLGLLLFASCVPTTPVKNSTGNYYRVHKEEFIKTLGDSSGILLDVRTPEEFASGHIEGAININLFDSNFAAQVEGLDLKKPIFVYCKSGGRSGKSAQVLLKKGARKVYDLIGGYSRYNP